MLTDVPSVRQMFRELGIGDVSAVSSPPEVRPLSNGSPAVSSPSGGAPLSLEEKQRRARQQEAAARLSSQPRLTGPSAAPAPANSRPPRDLTDSLISSNLSMMARPPATAAFHGPAPGYRPSGGAVPQQPAGFQPQSAGFQPQPAGFQPQSVGFQPQTAGFQPQPAGFQPQLVGFQQAGFPQRQPLGAGGPMIGAPGFGRPALPAAPSTAFPQSDGWSSQQQRPAQSGLTGPPAAVGSGFTPQYGQPAPSKQLSANEISDLLS